MNQLSNTSVASRLNALVAAAVVTLVMLASIDTLATTLAAAPRVAQAVQAQPA